MSSLFDSLEERTEKATSFRREEFRKRGRVAVSRELSGVVLLLAAGGALYLSGSHMFEEFTRVARRFFDVSRVQELSRGEIVEIAMLGVRAIVSMAVPVMAVALLAGIFVLVSQVGMCVATEPLHPNWERIDPVRGLKRIFSSAGLVEGLKAIFKCAIVGLVAWAFLKAQAPEAGRFFGMPVVEGSTGIMAGLFKLFVSILLALLVVAAGDYGFQRFRLEKEMRMTRREAKEEMKLREGDPLVRSRIRATQRRIAGRRSLAAVSGADVVVMGPEDFAVALKYETGNMNAPKVVAKGTGREAARIRRLAKNGQVPLVDNRALARDLFRKIDVGQIIPRDLYKTVAEVLACVYRLRRTA